MVDKNCKKLRYSSCCFIKLEQIPSDNLDLIVGSKIFFTKCNLNKLQVGIPQIFTQTYPINLCDSNICHFSDQNKKDNVTKKEIAISGNIFSRI